MPRQSLFLKDKTTFLKNAFSLYLLSSQGKVICLIFYTPAFVFLFCSVFFHYVTCFSACRGQAVVQGQYAMTWATTREPGDGPAINPNPCT